MAPKTTSLSHYLRTPLTSIIGAVTSLRSFGNRMPPEDRRALLQLIDHRKSLVSSLPGLIACVYDVLKGSVRRRPTPTVRNACASFAASAITT